MGLLNENIAQTISDFNNIKSKIIENGVEVPDGTKTSEYANKIDEVSEKATSEGYNIGKEDGYEEGYNRGWNVGNNDGLTEGYNNGYTTGKEDGIQSEYDRFWDNYQSQNGGTRTSYMGAFSGIGWNTGIFKPKYNIQPTVADNMFYNFGGILNANGTRSPLDLVEYLDSLDVILDFSKCTQANYVFTYGNLSRVGVIDFSNFPKNQTMGTVFTLCSKLITIDELILSETSGSTYTAMFDSCSNLTNLTIGGVIANNFRVRDCTKLTHDSLMSIINHLKDFSGTTTTKTLTLGTTNLAKLTDDEKAIATEKGWTLA